MIRITQLKRKPDEDGKGLEKAVRDALHLKEGEAFSFEVLRRSIDARKKPQLYEIFTVSVSLSNECAEKRILRSGLKNVEPYHPAVYRYSAHAPQRAVSQATSGQRASDPDRPLIVGSGPAGLFCGLLLARENRRPILIERGPRAAERSRSVHEFWNDGVLNPEANVQFGEGGAGTFSDGKLNTGVKDPEGRIRFVLETFVQAGADPEILTSAKPHIGTDVLKRVVTSMTDEICQRGGDVFFGTRMDQIRCRENGIWQVSCSTVDGGTLLFSTRHLVLAVGHSARDTFCMLRDFGIVMQPKSFAVGIRIQHPQELIDRAMYGDIFAGRLSAASYKLTRRLSDGRGVYSFCMCPGGYVVNASSEEGFLAVNGMSYHGRSSGAANSAIVVTVSPEEIRSWMSGSPRQIPEEDVLIGMWFQRQLEKAAYDAGGGAIPVQRFEDFRLSSDRDPFHPGSHALPDFEPQICGKWKTASLRQIFPDRVSAGIAEGMLAWERQIEGFSSPDALLCAAESRTSSPVRIERGSDFQAVGHSGLYPCGEGAGYAGGITSAAVDGLKIAEQILRALT